MKFSEIEVGEVYAAANYSARYSDNIKVRVLSKGKFEVRNPDRFGRRVKPMVMVNRIEVKPEPGHHAGTTWDARGDGTYLVTGAKLVQLWSEHEKAQQISDARKRERAAQERELRARLDGAGLQCVQINHSMYGPDRLSIRLDGEVLDSVLTRLGEPA